MFDVGFWELALIFVVALVVVGPERMPGLIRTSGQWLGRMQRVARELRAEFEREAHTEEFKALNREFLEEDRRLKQLALNPLSAPTSRAAALDNAMADNAATAADDMTDLDHTTAADSAVPTPAPVLPEPAATKTEHSA
jgi:sec-independent protein translocase protein TatB